MNGLLRAGYQKSSHLGLIVVSFAAISMCFNMAFAQAPVASVDITSPAEGKPYGGAPIGKLDIYVQGDRIKFVGKMNISPEANKVFEGWLVDAGNKASGYMLSLGKFNKTQILEIEENMVNPYTYLEFQVTQEPNQDLDPKAAKASGGILLSAPFGQ
jgi:hypothetical protein